MAVTIKKPYKEVETGQNYGTISHGQPFVTKVISGKCLFIAFPNCPSFFRPQFCMGPSYIKKTWSLDSHSIL